MLRRMSTPEVARNFFFLLTCTLMIFINFVFLLIPTLHPNQPSIQNTTSNGSHAGLVSIQKIYLLLVYYDVRTDGCVCVFLSKIDLSIFDWINSPQNHTNLSYNIANIFLTTTQRKKNYPPVMNTFLWSFFFVWDRKKVPSFDGVSPSIPLRLKSLKNILKTKNKLTWFLGYIYLNTKTSVQFSFSAGFDLRLICVFVFYVCVMSVYVWCLLLSCIGMSYVSCRLCT